MTAIHSSLFCRLLLLWGLLNCKFILLTLIISFAWLSGGLASGEPLPPGLSFIGLKAGAWQIYLARKPHTLEVVRTESEPRSATFNCRTGTVAYAGADGTIREVSLKDATDRLILGVQKEWMFTEPTYSEDGNTLVMVGMKGRSSQDTEIVAINRDDPANKVRFITSQPGAQFDPYLTNNNVLFYTSVSCSQGCGKIIQEIWRKDLRTMEAEQITLSNAVSKQPIVSKDAPWLYFSSNKTGSYHIWRMNLSGVSMEEELTFARSTDVSPVLDTSGNLYFIRHSEQGVDLIVKHQNGVEKPMQIDNDITEMRDLELCR